MTAFVVHQELSVSVAEIQLCGSLNALIVCTCEVRPSPPSQPLDTGSMKILWM